MGKGLADGITQGAAGPDEFRTAPLWGIGQRIFFLHDARTSNLVEAIRAHKSRGSEANKVIDQFNKLSAQEQQEIVELPACALDDCGDAGQRSSLARARGPAEFGFLPQVCSTVRDSGCSISASRKSLAGKTMHALQRSIHSDTNG
jgi:hypothetical protein